MNQNEIMTQRRQPVTKKRKRLYIVNRARFVIMTVITLIVLSTFFSYISGLFMSEATLSSDRLTIEVSSGDTLWKLASQYNYFEEDIRAVVYRIKSINHMESSDLVAGQTLIIPLTHSK